MHDDKLHLWQHSHTFGQDIKRAGEARTFIVIGITAIMMVVEVIAGLLFGSMALLADGLHMASHAVALGINAFAYVYARRHAHNREFSFGTGKVNALGGFTGAVLLAVFAAMMAWGSAVRLVQPVEIIFDQAILVAVIGLLVNGVSALILGADEPGHEHAHHHHGHHHVHHHDHNLKSAYLHVLADALTSVLAIIALLAGKYLGYVWMDPAMGFVGAFLVTRWSLGLLHSTSAILLDHQGPQAIRERISADIERDGDSRVADLHLWSIGPNLYAVSVTVVAHAPATPGEYKRRIADDLGLAHITVEVHQCEP